MSGSRSRRRWGWRAHELPCRGTFSVSRSVHVLAQAKVNLTLEVLGRRADGFHELRSVLATVELADTIRVATSARLDVRLSPDVGAPPGDDLASRAVRAFAAASGREPRALVRVRKRIPVAAGLGGGSSDAGAVMRALATLWRVPQPTADAAASVGSDVPFFASGAVVALVGGRGEVVEPLPAPPSELWLVLVRPAVALRTAEVFAAHDAVAGHGAGHADGAASERLAAAFRAGSVTPALLRDCARNDVLAAAERTCGWIVEARSAARGRGIELHLSGSGPSLFAVADDRVQALRIARALRRAGLRPLATRCAIAQ